MSALHRNVLMRHGKRLAARVPRLWARRFASGSPPGLSRILVHSSPKSGTHLATQIVRTLPGVRFYASFLASTPPLALTERSDRSVSTILRGAPPGEMLPAHLFYKDHFPALLADCHFASYFVHRDPRDVVCSAAHHITHMNRWHRMHRVFARLPDNNARIELAIRGMNGTEGDFRYPDINRQFRNYAGWLDDPNTHSVRYEVLVGDRCRDTVSEIVRFYVGRTPHPAVARADADSLAEKAMQAVDPERSHTFRKGGGVGGWRRMFTERHREQFKEIAGELLVALGYENDLSW